MDFRHIKAFIAVADTLSVTKAAERLLRFYERANPFVSGPKWLSS